MQISLKLLGRQAVSALLLVMAVLFAVVPGFHSHGPKIEVRAHLQVVAAPEAYTLVAVRPSPAAALDAAEPAEGPCHLCRWANQTPGRAHAVLTVRPFGFRQAEFPVRESRVGQKVSATDQPRAPPRQA